MLSSIQGAPGRIFPEALSPSEAVIKARYVALGGATWLGSIASKEVGGTPGQVVAWHFAGGFALVHNPLGAAYLISGAVYEKWVRLGGVAFGIPDGDKARPRNGWSRYCDFSGKRASIYWSATTGAFEVKEPIRAHWLALGGITGPGYPISGETLTADGAGRFNRFERGGMIHCADQSDPAYVPAAM